RRTPRPLSPARQSPKVRREIGKQWIPWCRRTQRPLPPARQSSKARQEVGKQWIPSCRRTQRPLPPARCLAARSWQHGAARSSPLAIAGAMPSKGGRHRPGVEAIYQDAITRLLTAIMPGEAIEEPCYLLHRICRLMALSGLSAISSRTIDVGFSLIAHVTLCDTVGRSREMVPLGDSSIPRLLSPAHVGAFFANPTMGSVRNSAGRQLEGAGFPASQLLPCVVSRMHGACVPAKRVMFWLFFFRVPLGPFFRCFFSAPHPAVSPQRCGDRSVRSRSRSIGRRYL